MALAHQPPDKVFKQTRLLTEKGGGVGIIGLVAERMDNHRQVWALPNCVRDHLAEWLDVAVQQWQNRDKTAFPRLDWAAQEDWMDSDELDAAARLRQHGAEAEATMARLSRERARLVDAQATARNAADQGLRQLLTTNSDALVDAVSSTLEDLGFTVVDADSLERARKFEDLQVFDGDWVCLVEVKGYEKRNAKTADLVQLAGAVSHYQEDHPAPSAQWYIINQSYATPPSLRLNPFKSDPDIVEQFANNNGLVIDTRELFRLVTRVHQEELSRDEARGLLRKTRGVFTAQD